MLWNASALRGFAVEATDGTIGTVSDLLFDDATWTTRWLVVETGSFFSTHKILLPVSALGKPDAERQKFGVEITRKQVQDSPGVDTDLPVSRHREANVYNYYGWNPYWTSGFAPMSNAIATPLVAPYVRDDMGARAQDIATDAVPDDGDPHLRSVMAVIGYHIAATDGDIGHVEEFLINDKDWKLAFMTVDTKNWLPGKRVLLPVRVIGEIDWFNKKMRVGIDRAHIKASPPYDRQMTADGPYNEQFHKYLGLTLLDAQELQRVDIAPFVPGQNPSLLPPA